MHGFVYVLESVGGEIMGMRRICHKITAVLATCLSHITVAVVAYNYCALQWGGKYAGYSAPPTVALLYGLPFIAAIIVCLIIARFLKEN